LATPSDAINNAFAGITSRCAPDCDRATDSSNSRCPAEISNAATGFLMERIYRTNRYLFARHTTRNQASPAVCGSGGRAQKVLPCSGNGKR
jgi:hypothetical protein